MRCVNFLNNALLNLGSWSTTSNQHARYLITGASHGVRPVSVARVGIAWTLRDSAIGRPSSQSNQITPPRREERRRGWSRRRGPTWSALSRRTRVAVLWPPKCPASPQSPSVAGYRQTVRLALPVAVVKAAANDAAPSGGAGHGGRHRVTTVVDGATHGGGCAIEDGAKDVVREERGLSHLRACQRSEDWRPGAFDTAPRPNAAGSQSSDDSVRRRSGAFRSRPRLPPLHRVGQWRLPPQPAQRLLEGGPSPPPLRRVEQCRCREGPCESRDQRG